MVRYSKEHKLATRQRIVERAGRRFKRQGFDGSGIATLMADAGLTNGAFYAHFDSKDDLAATVLSDQLAAQVAALRDLEDGPAGLETFIRSYLSAEHRDEAEAGCPSAALLDEVARSSDGVKGAYTDGARQIVAEIAGHIDPERPAKARRVAVGLYTLLVATLQLSRAVTDPDFSDEILAHGLDNALALLHGDVPG